MTAETQQSDVELARRLTDAQTIVDKIVRRAQLRAGFQPEDVDDLRATVMLRLVQRLSSLYAEPPVSFDDFVAATTFHAIDDLLRKRNPERAALKNRIRYTLLNDSRLALRSSARGLVAALAAWPDDAPPVAIPPGFPAGDPLPENGRRADAVYAFLLRAGGPVDLDDLVGHAAAAWQVRHLDAVVSEGLERIVDPAPQPGAVHEARESLRMLWSEIVQLPQPQRVALLLGLREAHGTSAIPMLIFSGVAALDDIAGALAMTRPELETLWNDLPLDDERIRLRLGVTRQQVANLRKTARERLARRRKKERF